MRKVFGLCGAVLIAFAVHVSPVSADPVTGGTLAPITLEVGGISGSITFDATGTTVTGFNIFVSGGTDAFGFTYADFTYDATNSRVTFTHDSVFNGQLLSTLDIRTLNYSANTTGSRDLSLTFDRMPSTIPAGGAALTICSDLGRVCGDPASGINIPSGEAVIDTTVPAGWHTRGVTAGFFTVSDPPNSLSLNFTLTPVLIPVDDGSNGGGGTGTPVPEPGVLTQLGASAVGLFLMARKRKQQ
jgi:hypothetical protein